MRPAKRPAGEPDAHVGKVVNIDARRRFKPRRDGQRRLAAKNPVHQVKDVPPVINKNPAARSRRSSPPGARSTGAGGFSSEAIERDETNRPELAGVNCAARGGIGGR